MESKCQKSNRTYRKKLMLNKSESKNTRFQNAYPGCKKKYYQMV